MQTKTNLKAGRPRNLDLFFANHAKTAGASGIDGKRRDYGAGKWQTLLRSLRGTGRRYFD